MHWKELPLHCGDIKEMISLVRTVNEVETRMQVVNEILNRNICLTTFWNHSSSHNSLSEQDFSDSFRCLLLKLKSDIIVRVIFICSRVPFHYCACKIDREREREGGGKDASVSVRLFKFHASARRLLTPGYSYEDLRDRCLNLVSAQLMSHDTTYTSMMLCCQKTVKKSDNQRYHCIFSYFCRKESLQNITCLKSVFMIDLHKMPQTHHRV